VRHAEEVMGTVISIDVPDHTNLDLIKNACDWFHHVERLFSVFEETSEISRIGRGEMSVDSSDPTVRYVLTKCDELWVQTEGAFRHRNRTPDRPIDPSGYVKGWSVERALLDLQLAGVERACIGAGGDIAGYVGEGDSPWKVGIRNPEDPDGVAAILKLTNGGVATSGEYERGPHIQSSAPKTDQGTIAEAPLTSISVVGPDLGTCDALATAIWADGAPAGESTPNWMVNFADYDTLACTADGRIIYSERLQESITAG